MKERYTGIRVPQPEHRYTARVISLSIEFLRALSVRAPQFVQPGIVYGMASIQYI